MKRIEDPIQALQAQREASAEERTGRTSHWHKVYRNASHDLKEPLRMVCTYSSLLRAEHADSLDATGKEYLQYVVDGAHRLRKQTESLLRLFSLEFNEFSMGVVSMDEALLSALAALKPVITRQKAAIRTSPLTAIWGNAELLRQLLYCILENSLKFAPASKTPLISIRCRADGDSVIYSVFDDGEGVPESSLEEIFEPFRRLRPRTLFEGEGLGLAFCQRVVTLHEGTIWAESHSDGFSVHFSIPIGEKRTDSLTRH